jgi:serine/threonine-protein kinase
MSEVWLARDERLGRTVAIKLVRPEMESGEARMVARLQHPNIVAVHDAGESDGTSYLVMEYVEGRSLRELLREEGSLSEGRAVQLGLQIAAALDHAHHHGVVHRDLKPENVLVTPDWRAKVTDFGIALNLGATLAPGQVEEIAGTIANMAPEVLRGEPPGPQSDIYSLGLTIYEMVTGQLPPGSGIEGAGEAGDSPLTGLLDTSPVLEDVLARAFAPASADRYRSAADLAAGLRFAQQRSTATTPVLLPAKRPAGRSGRRLRPYALLAIAGLAIIAAAGLALARDDGGDGGLAGTGTPTAAPSQAPTQLLSTATAPPSNSGPGNKGKKKN